MQRHLTLAALAAATLSTQAVAAPGVGGIFLDINGGVFNGETLEFVVTDAAPGKYVGIVYGGKEEIGAACPAELAPMCIDVRNYKLLAQPKRVPSSGTVTFTVRVPASLPAGALGFFQALQNGGASFAASSNVVAKFNPLPTGGDLGMVLAGFYSVVPGTSLAGFRLEEYYVERAVGADTVYLQWCRGAWDAVGTPSTTPCPGCDFAFDVTNTNPTDASLTGDCLDYLGTDPTTWGDFTESWALDSDYYHAGYGNYETVLLLADTDDDPLTPDVWAWALRSVVPYPIFYTGGGEFSWVYDAGVIAPAFY